MPFSGEPSTTMSWRSGSPSEAGSEVDAELVDRYSEASAPEFAAVAAGRGKAERLEEPGQRPGRGDGVDIRIVVRLHGHRAPCLEAGDQRPEMLSHWGLATRRFFSACRRRYSSVLPRFMSSTSERYLDARSILPLHIQYSER